MTVFELYMLYLMVAVLRQFCLYCTAAMGLVAGLWLVTVFGHRWLDWAKLAFSYILVGLFTLVVTLGVYAKQAPPPSPLAAGLAAHLRKIGATMYGAYWCPHCQEQKALFGSAFAQIPYVECSPNGPGTPQVEECTKAGITSYPTWIINGRSYVGLRSLEALAVASGYSFEGGGRAGLTALKTDTTLDKGGLFPRPLARSGVYLHCPTGGIFTGSLPVELSFS
jgi:glutaredoxin